jgi:PIN domain
MPRYTAVLDACVLVPIALADTLLRVAERGLYRPLWSDRILGEAQAAIEEIHPGIAAAERFASMREAFDDAFVAGWEELEPGLPDEDDRHVLAAAVRGGAQCIITANAKDFPAAALEPIGLEAVHPDDFLLDQVDLSPATSCRSSASRPPTPGGRRSPRETWPPSSAGSASQTSPTRSSDSWLPLSTAPDTGHRRGGERRLRTVSIILKRHSGLA